MNWYKALKYAMPLPAIQPGAKPYPAEAHNYGRGIVDIDRTLSEENAQKVSRLYPGLGYLGHGEHGLAFVHSTPHVVTKLTRDREEAMLATSLMKNPVECVVRVYGVREVQQSPRIWAIEAEKVIPLSANEARVVDYVYDNPNPSTWGGNVDDFEQEVIEKYQDLVECLMMNRMKADDALSANVGKREDGSYVLLDLGFANTSER